MIRFAIRGLLAMGLLLAGLSVHAQGTPQEERQKAVPTLTDGVQLKVQIVFSEYEGNKKTTSLPYTLLVPVTHDALRNKIRIENRIPIAMSETNSQYMDSGTNIDCGAKLASEGRYELVMTLDRHWLDMPAEAPAEKSGTSQEDAHPGKFRQPTLRHFTVESNVIARDGQTIETTLATDPVSGKVIKLEVTVNVLK